MKLRVSEHFKNDRKERFEAIKQIGLGHEIARKVIAKNEVRIATNTGVIIVVNPYKSTKDCLFVVTMYIARLAQFERITTPTPDVLAQIKRNELAHCYNI